LTFCPSVLLAAFFKGFGETAMPKWGPNLTADERSLLTRYVRSFYGTRNME
jgi:hypothetical protein